MWQAWGSVLGQAVAIAISPGPIIAVILVLLSARATTNSFLFLAGWVAGVGGVFMLVGVVADSADVSEGGGASDGQAVVQLLFAALFLALAAKQWRGRRKEGEPPESSPFLEKLADMGPGMAVGLALLMSAANPKNLPLIISAGSEAARAGLSTGELAGTAVAFTITASVGVGVPIGFSLAKGDGATATLASWRDWMAENSSTIMIVLFVVLAAMMGGSGISTLAT